MSCIAVSNTYVAVAKGMYIDCYDPSENTNIPISIPIVSKPQENDSISDIIISSDSKYLAAVFSVSKQLTVVYLPLSDGRSKNFILPRSASKIRFTNTNEQILVADKTGDVFLYNFKTDTEHGTKLLGHLSLLLDILQTDDGKFIITSDRDEKIKVSCYPNTYNIQTYCLGHKEFVKYIEILPHNKKYLVSTSGDGTVKCWNYLDGRCCHNMNTNVDISDEKLKEDFIKSMNDDGMEVDALPIVYSTICQLDETSSILVLAVHTCKTLLVYRLQTVNEEFSHELLTKIKLERFPAAIKLHNLSLYVYDDENNRIQVSKIHFIDKCIKIESNNVIEMFARTEKDFVIADGKDNGDSIKVLYKRKFDNVKEYQERKKQRLEKTAT